MIQRMWLKYRSLPKQVKASVWFLTCSFLQRGISTITTPIFTRLLDTSEYGRFNVFNSWLGIATIFVTMQLYSGVYYQGLIKFNKDRNTFSSSLQGLTLVFITIWTGIYFLERNFWNNLFSLTTVQMLAMLIMIWATAVFNFWAAEQRVQLQYVTLVAITLLVSIAKPVVGIILVIFAEDKVTARILGLALVELTAFFPLFISQMMKGKRFYNAYYWKYAVYFNLPLIPHYLSQTVLNSADRIMINTMVGGSEAGIYSLAYSVSLIMLLFNTALGQTIAPWTYQKIKDGKTNDIGSVVYSSLVIIASANIMLIAFAPEIISIFAPESYFEAIWVIPPVAMSVYFLFMYDRFVAFEFFYEKTKFTMFVSLFAAILNIILNYFFINIFGYIAAAYTTLVCYVVYAVSHYVFMRWVCKRQMNGKVVFNLKILIEITVVFLALGFVFLLLYNHIFIRYCTLTLLLTLIFINRNKIVTAINKTFKIKK